MLTTPAIASEPYCAAAPSRSTSTWSIAASGIAFRSTGAEPRPRVPLTLTTAEVWRRLPFTSTRVWSGDRPRSWAGRTASLASAPTGRGKFIDGSRRDSTVASSFEPVPSSSLLPMTSTGDSVSRVRRFSERVPVTTTACISPAAAWRRRLPGPGFGLRRGRLEAIRPSASRARPGFERGCLTLMFFFLCVARLQGREGGRE
jgi:hypothetical protein